MLLTSIRNMWREIPVFVRKFRRSRLEDEEASREKQFIRAALEKEKLEGHRIAVISRTIALIIIALILPIMNFHWSVFYYQALIMGFVAIGWLQYKHAQVGQSGKETLLLMADLALLAFIAVAPNPFMTEEVPTAFSLRFDSFIYFFVFLAVATLAYSWRTVWFVGGVVTVFWFIGVTYVGLFGHTMPELGKAVQAAMPNNPLLFKMLDPNSIELDRRIQEVVVFVIVAFILALKGWRTTELVKKQAQSASERANLSQYFSPNMVDMLATSDFDPGAVRNENVAVLFTDIVGFTSLAEKENADAVMRLLRGYHAVIENAVFENSGTLDKYLGDGVMATFGTPQSGEHDAHNALTAARQILRDVETLNEQMKDIIPGGIKVSVGVHFGPVILGDIGPSRRLEFAVIGDTVNVASRLESMTRELGCSLCLSDELVAKASADNQNEAPVIGLDRRNGVKLRGRSKPMTVWTA